MKAIILSAFAVVLLAGCAQANVPATPTAYTSPTATPVQAVGKTSTPSKYGKPKGVVIFWECFPPNKLFPHYECQAEDDLTGPVTAWTCEQIKREAYNVFMIGFGTPPETLDAGFVLDLWVYIDVDSPTGQQVAEVLWNKATVEISTMTPDQAWDHYEQYTECRLAQ